MHTTACVIYRLFKSDKCSKERYVEKIIILYGKILLFKTVFMNFYFKTIEILYSLFNFVLTRISMQILNV